MYGWLRSVPMIVSESILMSSSMRSFPCFMQVGHIKGVDQGLVTLYKSLKGITTLLRSKPPHDKCDMTWSKG